jgi:hypothetical protein
MSPHAARPVVCENCDAALQGDFCHVCGQAAHSPVRSFAHALEEVVESFWHLDGRIFRTLRELLVPGRVAVAYLRGRRTPYVAPMRLFVVLAVLTFFVARLAVHIDGDANTLPATAAKDFGQARTPAEVELTRQRMSSELVGARDALPAGLEGARGGIERELARIDSAAAGRLAELQAAPARPQPAVEGDLSDAFSPNGRPWNARTNPVTLDWLPGFGNRWLNAQIDHVQHNLPRLRDNPQLLFNAFFAAVPSVLFVLVPLFALLLRVLYLGSGRVYLEHLVVALYSHAFLCLDLLAVLLLSLLGDALAGVAAWTGGLIGLLQFLLLAWMPCYLLWMQQRVYRQFWLVTALKYAVLGGIYFVGVAFASAALMVYSLTRF